MKLLIILTITSFVITSVCAGDWCGAIPRNIYGTSFILESSTEVDSCDSCEKNLCVKSKLYSRVDDICYWNEDSGKCLPGSGWYFHLYDK